MYDSGFRTVTVIYVQVFEGDEYDVYEKGPWFLLAVLFRLSENCYSDRIS